MTDTPLEGLIAKLIAGEGSRELDAQIWESVNFRAALRCYWSAAAGKPVQLHSLPESGLGWLAVKNNAPHYTTSIDAKLPGENIVELARIGRSYRFYRVWHVDEHDRRFNGEHAVEAIARRIAALRARA